MNWGRYLTLIVILGLTLLQIIVQGLRINYLGELLIFVLFMIASLIIIVSIYKKREIGWFAAAFFLISIINLFYIKAAFVVHPKVNVGLLGWLLFGVTLLLNTLAFLLNVISIKRCYMSEEEKEEIIEKEIVPKIKELEEQVEKQVKRSNVKTEVYPGRYIASKSGSVYHTAKCDWAKKISKKNQVWFDDKKEAKKAGYKQHSCLKN
jgi:hypothetical protein